MSIVSTSPGIVRAEDLAEDRLTSWLPDSAGDVDLEAYCSGADPGSGSLALPLRVPKPTGGHMLVQQLHPGWVVQLRRAIAPVVDQIDGVLDEGVFGYRRGAAADAPYARQYTQFREYTAKRSAASEPCRLCRHQEFLPLGRSLLGCGRAGTNGRTVHARSCSRRRRLAHSRPHVSPGRVLRRPSSANVVLHAVDTSLTVPLARWVDDYRLFVPKGVDPQGAPSIRSTLRWPTLD